VQNDEGRRDLFRDVDLLDHIADDIETSPAATEQRRVEGIRLRDETIEIGAGAGTA